MPTSGEAHRLSARLLRVSERIRADFAAIAADFDLTVLQARSLLFLEEDRPMRALAEHLGSEPSNVTGLADRLESAGLIQRVAGTDRRVTLLRLTSAGRRLRARLAERVAAEATVMARLDAAQRRTLAQLLDQLLA